MIKALYFLLFSVLFAYAQQERHEHNHRMSPQVHRCMKVMDDPRYMEEMMAYMLQKKEEMRKILERNPEIRKHMEELIK